MGTRLAALKEPIRFLDGQSEGVGRSVANAFGSAVLHAKQDLRARVRYFPNPYSVNPAMSNNPSLLPTLKAWRASLFRAARTVVVFDGGMGTQAEVDVARSLRCNIIPVLGKPKGLAATLLRDRGIKTALNLFDRSYVGKALAGKATIDDVVAVIEKSLA